MSRSHAYTEDHVTEELRLSAPYDVRDIDLSSAEGFTPLATTRHPRAAGVSLNAQLELP